MKRAVLIKKQLIARTNENPAKQAGFGEAFSSLLKLRPQVPATNAKSRQAKANEQKNAWLRHRIDG